MSSVHDLATGCPKEFTGRGRSVLVEKAIRELDEG